MSWRTACNRCWGRAFRPDKPRVRKRVSFARWSNSTGCPVWNANSAGLASSTSRLTRPTWPGCHPSPTRMTNSFSSGRNSSTLDSVHSMAFGDHAARLVEHGLHFVVLEAERGPARCRRRGFRDRLPMGLEASRIGDGARPRQRAETHDPRPYSQDRAAPFGPAGLGGDGPVDGLRLFPSCRRPTRHWRPGHGRTTLKQQHRRCRGSDRRCHHY